MRNSIVQAPVRYRCRRTPTRAGVYHPPYTIINELPSPPSIGASPPTVWVADNAGLLIGTGTPIYPGTSVTWTQEGELWVVAERDTDIIVSYDIEDWQPDPTAIAAAILTSGIVIIDDPVQLFNTTALQAITGPFDVSRYQSLWFNATRTAGFANTDDITIVFTKDDASEIVHQLGYAWYPNNTGPEPNAQMSVRFGIPCVADSMFVIFNSPGGSTFRAQMIASYRQLSRLTQSISGINNAFPTVRAPTCLYASNQPALAIASHNFHIPPWYGEMEVKSYIFFTGAIGASTRLIIGQENMTIDAVPYVAVPGVSTQASAKYRLFNNGGSLLVTHVNATAGTVIHRLEVHAARSDGN